MDRMHGLSRKRRRCIAHQRDVLPNPHAELARGLQAGVGQYANQDVLVHAVMLELQFQVRVGGPLRSKCK
jgi:hypothetical protein